MLTGLRFQRIGSFFLVLGVVLFGLACQGTKTEAKVVPTETPTKVINTIDPTVDPTIFFQESGLFTPVLETSTPHPESESDLRVLSWTIVSGLTSEFTRFKISVKFERPKTSYSLVRDISGYSLPEGCILDQTPEVKLLEIQVLLSLDCGEAFLEGFEEFVLEEASSAQGELSGLEADLEEDLQKAIVYLEDLKWERDKECLETGSKILLLGSCLKPSREIELEKGIESQRLKVENFQSRVQDLQKVRPTYRGLAGDWIKANIWVRFSTS